jgi:hypothetical protein
MEDKQHQYRRRTRAGRSQVAELVASGRQEMSQPAREAIGHLYATLLTLPTIKLSNDVSAIVEPFVAPEADAEGRLRCGIDLRLSDGSMLEFMLTNTGWGKPFAQGVIEQGRNGGKDRSH